MIEAYQPLTAYLNAHLPNIHIELEPSADYQAYEQKFRAREPELLLPNPWQTLQAQKVGYTVLAMAGDASDFKGIFIVRRDSGIQTPADLKGKTVSYPSPTALAAAIMPQYFLHQRGVDINRDITNRYVGSQESSIMSVYLKEAAAGATWPPPWRLFQRDHPKEAAELTVAWETPPLVNNSIMARDDIPAALREQLAHVLITMQDTDEGRAVLKGIETARFHAADDSTYQEAADFIARFEREVRQVERK